MWINKLLTFLLTPQLLDQDQSSEIVVHQRNRVKVIPLKLFYYQTFLKLSEINIHDMNIKKMQ